MSFSPSGADYAALNHAQLVARLAALDSLQEELKESREALAQLHEQNALLKEQLNWFRQQVFGRSSEKSKAEEISPDQGRLFNEAEALSDATAPETVTIPTHERRKRGRKKLPAELPRVDVIHDLPETEKVCVGDGTPLQRIGEEVSEQLDYIPAKVRVLRHVRYKYACPCCRQNIRLASAPTQILPKSNATPSLLAHIVTAKYVDGLPLHRQERQFERLGVTLGRATMANWMIRLGAQMIPLINLLNERLLESALVHCDETPLQVLRGGGSDKHFIWVRASGPPGQRIVLYDHAASRAGSVAKELLNGFKGILLTDGYEPYDTVAEAGSLLHAGCWAHARRYFKDAQKVSGNEHGHAHQALAFIGQLYRIERGLRDHQATPEEKHEARQQHSAPVIAAFRDWLETLAGQVLPKSALGKAVHYTLGQWTKLACFLDHGEIPLDNNRVENAIRPFVIGRRNWLFSDTPRGADASARLYSLVETAKVNGIEPHAYLTHVFAELPKATTVDDFEALLPWNVKRVIARA
jgi:transposase